MTVPGVPYVSLIFNEFTFATFNKDGLITKPFFFFFSSELILIGTRLKLGGLGGPSPVG